MAAIFLPGGDPFGLSSIVAAAQPHGDPYEGLIASKAGYVSQASGTNKQVQARSYHVASDDITSLKIAVGNWYMSIADGIGVTMTEVGSGGNCTITASIEYPIGSYTQITFSSGASSIVVPTGTTRFSDYCTPALTIPRGAVFGIGQYRVYAGNGLYNPFRNSSVGGAQNDQCRVAASGLSDVTMGGTLTDDSVHGCPPLAIIGMTRRASLVVIGDSVGAGRFTNTSQPDWRQGIICAGLPVDYPFLNLSLGGEAASTALTNGTGRGPLWPYCSHFVSQEGANDLLAGSSAATLKTNQEAILATLPAGPRKLVTTIIPNTSSASGNYLSDADQTNNWGSNQATYNASVRSGSIVGADDYLEVEHACESSSGSRKWKSDGTPKKYVFDGIHPVSFGYSAISTIVLGTMSQLRYP